MDAPEDMEALFEIGTLTGKREVQAEDFPTKFDVPPR